MKRFVDMRAADIAGFRFAFWDTIVSQFQYFNNIAAWDDLPEFLGDCAHDRAPLALIDRLVGLMPDWARTPCSMDDHTEYEVVEIEEKK